MSAWTNHVAAQLVKQQYLVDFAPGEKGLFLRVVVNLETRMDTLKRVAACVEELWISRKEGKQVEVNGA